MVGFSVPRWLEVAVIVFVPIGFLATVGAVIAGIVWLVQHVRFAP